MKKNKTVMSVIFTVLLVGVCASPAWAHRRYRPNPSGPPRKVAIRHTHEPTEAEKPLAQSTVASEQKKFDPLKGVFDLIEGALKALGNTVNSLIGNQPEATKIAKDPEKKKEYKYVRRYADGGPRWVRKRI